MQVYDIVMIAVLAVAILFGAWKGLAWQVASLAAIFVSYFVALTFRAPVAALIKTEEPWNRFIAMFGLFLVTSLGIWIMFGYISKSIEKMQLKSFDRQAGALVGAVKGALLCLVITFFAVTLLSPAQKKSICDSYSGRYIAQTIDHLHGVMPTEVHQVVKPYLEKIDEELNKNHDADQDPEAEDENPVVDALFADDRQIQNKVKNGVDQLENAANDIRDKMKSIPIDPAKIDWRKVDWQQAAEAITDQAGQNR